MFKSSSKNTKKSSGSIHVIFGATCSPSMDWKSIAVFHTFKTSGWKDTNITRLLACTPEQLKSYKGMDIGPTFVFNDQQSVSGYGDSPTYNKPAGIMHFTQEANIEEEFILFVDADMLFRRVIHPHDFKARKGLVISEWVWYIQYGIRDGLAEQFLSSPQAIEHARNTHGGYYHLFHVEDARKVAPLWLHYTREFRHHPEKYFKDLPGSKLKHDIDTYQKGLGYGQVPWISEMYGYAFAAAEIGLEHKFTRGGGGVLYGDDFLTLNHDGPFLSHYTLSCHIPSIEIYNGDKNERNYDEDNPEFVFDKNHFRAFNPLDCNDGFLFKRPKISFVDEGAASCAENVERLNNALCDFYRRNCPPKSQAHKNAIRYCPWNPNTPFKLHYEKVIPAPCGNRLEEEYCKESVENGRCQEDPSFMQLNCLKECGFCAIMQPNSQYIDASNDCKDLIKPHLCNKLAAEMECVLNPTYMTVNCRSTCGKCPGSEYNAQSANKSTSTNASLLCNGRTISAVILVLVLINWSCRRRYFRRHLKAESTKAE